VARYEDDDTLRKLAHDALFVRCEWYGDLKMSDSSGAVTKFLQDWRAAQGRHGTGGLTIVQWASVWSDDNRKLYEKMHPYLADA
jgi:hypothetical protein